VGNYTYGNLNIYSYGHNDKFLTIENFCSIADNVEFNLGGEHSKEPISKFPFLNMILNSRKIENYPQGAIIVEDDVWIGRNCKSLEENV
jgi:acetyltransferase-like isoleucine patch superfamily enzyme